MKEGERRDGEKEIRTGKVSERETEIERERDYDLNIKIKIGKKYDNSGR